MTESELSPLPWTLLSVSSKVNDTDAGTSSNPKSLLDCSYIFSSIVNYFKALLSITVRRLRVINNSNAMKEFWNRIIPKNMSIIDSSLGLAHFFLPRITSS